MTIFAGKTSAKRSGAGLPASFRMRSQVDFQATGRASLAGAIVLALSLGLVGGGSSYALGLKMPTMKMPSMKMPAVKIPFMGKKKAPPSGKDASQGEASPAQGASQVEQAPEAKDEGKPVPQAEPAEVMPTPAEARNEAPGNAQAEVPAEARNEVSGNAQTEVPGNARADVAAEARTEAPGNARADVSAEARTEAPGNAHSEVPAEASGTGASRAVGATNAPGSSDSGALSTIAPANGFPATSTPPARERTAEIETEAMEDEVEPPSAQKIQDKEAQVAAPHLPGSAPAAAAAPKAPAEEARETPAAKGGENVNERNFRPGVDKPIDEAEAMEESEYEDEQERKKKEAFLNELLSPALPPHLRDPEIFYKEAVKLTAQRDYKNALLAINAALKLKPQYWEAHLQGAVILQLSGRADEAIERYKYLLNLRPDFLEAHTNLGSLLAKKGEYEAAEKQYKEALERNFYLVSAHYNLANLYVKLDRLNDAIKELKICIKMQPTNAWAHNNLGVIYEKRNYLEEASEEFLRALHLEPANKTFAANFNLVRDKMKKKPVRA